jgi:hypothetical protein
MKTPTDTNKKGAARQEPHNNEPPGNGDLPPDAVAQEQPRPNFEVPPPREESRSPEEIRPEEEEESEEDAASETETSNRQLLAALPPLMRGVCQEMMRFLNIPALLPAVCLLLAVSASLMRGLCCRANRGTIYPNLFAMLGADSGAGKSLAYNVAMAPLEELDAELLEAFQLAKAEMHAMLGLIKDDMTALHTKHTKARKGDTKLSEAETTALTNKLKALHQEQAELEKKLTQEPSLWCADFTGEAVGVLLSNNREQISVSSDEGTLTLNNLLGRYNDGNATDDALMCKGFTVNAHKIDRISRESISLKKPCISLLLLVQEDILRSAFNNTRLVLGGFLARCLSAHCRLKMQEETEENEAPLSPELLAQWRNLIRSLYHKFRCGPASFHLDVEPAVRVLSRQNYNAIASLVNKELRDIRSFCARWMEQTWKVAVVLHAGLYGEQCEAHLLSAETFKAAQAIIQLFCKEQLKVLGALRSERLHKTHLRLAELFLRNANASMRLRTLEKSHGMDRGEVEDCVRAHSKIYGLRQEKPPRGSASTVIFLRTFK